MRAARFLDSDCFSSLSVTDLRHPEYRNRICGTPAASERTLGESPRARSSPSSICIIRRPIHITISAQIPEHGQIQLHCIQPGSSRQGDDLSVRTKNEQVRMNRLPRRVDKQTSATPTFRAAMSARFFSPTSPARKGT